jgi:hypothetical protein
MSELISTQQETLDRRRGAFDQYFAELMPVLVDFCQRLQLPEPHRVLVDPYIFLPPIDEWVAQQEFGSESGKTDRVWLVTRLGYYLGELIVQRFHGCWFVEDNPNGRYFSNYVVGQFAHFPNGRIDPNLAIMEFLDQPVGRRLCQLVDEISAELIGRVADTQT